jgi:tetratricopeptide (TPR) repeat protein
MTSRQQRRASQRHRQPADIERSGLPVLPRANRWIVLALAVATVLAYVPALDAPFVIDDEGTIGASSEWKSLPGSPTAGRPLVMATLAANFAANRALGVDQRPDPDGPNKAIGYRLVNLLLHLLAGALLFGVVRRAMRERTIPEDWRALADPVAGVVCALWLLHPIQSEVINYIVQRSEALASICYLATLYASQRAWHATPTARLRWYALAVVACVLGMLSKEIVISAPLAVMLYDRAFRLPSWRALRRPGNGRGWLYVALWSACLVTFAVFEAGARGESTGFNAGMTWYGYLYTQCWAIAHYLRLAVWPNALSIDYGYRTIRGARGIPGLVLLCAFGAATLVAWTRAERFGWFAFLGSMFFMLLAPSSSVVPVLLEVAAERRVYLALAVVLVLAVVGVEWIRRRVAARVSPRWLTAGATGIVVALAIATAARSRTYASTEALWRSAVHAVPENSRARGQLGWALFRLPTPKLAEAESAFVRALAQDSACPGKCLEYGTLLSNGGRFAEAMPLLVRHLAWDHGNVLAARLLALDLMKLGDYHRAIPYLEEVVQRVPKESHFVMLGVAYLSAGRRDEAIATFRLMATFDVGSAELQQLSRRLEDGANHPEALSNLQEFAFWMARGWM